MLEPQQKIQFFGTACGKVVALVVVQALLFKSNFQKEGCMSESEFF